MNRFIDDSKIERGKKSIIFIVPLVLFIRKGLISGIFIFI